MTYFGCKVIPRILHKLQLKNGRRGCLRTGTMTEPLLSANSLSEDKLLASFVGRVKKYTRRKRFLFFIKAISNLDFRPIRIVDLGGTSRFWLNWGLGSEHNIHVTVVNNHHIDKSAKGYDNTLGYIHEQNEDVNLIESRFLKKFDLIFSNSLIEYLESWDLQMELCRKIEASERPFFIQIPNKLSLVDPHFPHPLVPFFAAYPKKLQASLLTVCRFGSGGRSSNIEEANRRVQFYNPLTKNQITRLIPGGTLTAESIMGITHSFIITKNLDLSINMTVE